MSFAFFGLLVAPSLAQPAGSPDQGSARAGRNDAQAPQPPDRSPSGTTHSQAGRRPAARDPNRPGRGEGLRREADPGTGPAARA